MLLIFSAKVRKNEIKDLQFLKVKISQSVPKNHLLVAWQR